MFFFDQRGRIMSYINFPSWITPEIIPGFSLLRWYGMMYIVAFAATYFLVKYQVKENNLDYKEDDITNLFFWAILGLILGARILSATLYDPTGKYLTQPWLIFWPFSGGKFTGLPGMSYHGGLIGLVVATLIYCKVKKFSWLVLLDLGVTAIPLGYMFGRIGNFINGELWGRVSTIPWGIIFPYAPRFSTSEEWVRIAASKNGMEIATAGEFINLPRHPSQLYEAFFEGIFLWAILWFVFRKRKKFNGQMIGLYLIGYGIVRFIIEYFREPDKGLDFPIQALSGPNYLLTSLFNISTGQILCFLMILSGSLLLVILNRRAKSSLKENNEKKAINSRKLRKKIK